MKLAIGYSTKDQVELTEQTFPRLHRYDASDSTFFGSMRQRTPEASEFAESNTVTLLPLRHGGADAAIAWKLTQDARRQADATPTSACWKTTSCSTRTGSSRPCNCSRKAKPMDWKSGQCLLGRMSIEFLSRGTATPSCTTSVPALSSSPGKPPRSSLRTFRTHWWPANATCSPSSAASTCAPTPAFGDNEQFVTTDWGWEAQLARHGLASLALTPAKCQMIGQVPPLKEQGLELVTRPVPGDLPILRDQFAIYRDNLQKIRDGVYKSESPGIIHRDGSGMLFFPHQLGTSQDVKPWQGTLELVWSQGFGPFAYRAGPGGASLSARISGSSLVPRQWRRSRRQGDDQGHPFWI